MTCEPINVELAERLKAMTDDELLNYCDQFTGLEGRELANELASRLRGRKLGELESEINI